MDSDPDSDPEHWKNINVFVFQLLLKIINYVFIVMIILKKYL